MANDIKTGFRRALDDMNEGIEALFGLRPGRADLVDELLAEGDEAAKPPQRFGVSSPRPRSHPRRARSRQRRRSAVRHLSLVE